MNGKKRVLVLCTGNSCRSQMAEGWIRRDLGDRVDVFSAGTRPSFVHPLSIRVMAEEGVDISGHRSKSVAEFAGQPFDLVITLCDSAREACPIFPGAAKVVHEPIPDPWSGAGTDEAAVPKYRETRSLIRGLIVPLVQQELAIHPTFISEVSMDSEAIKKSVREHYASVARNENGCCASPAVAATNCCGVADVEKVGKIIGYSDAEMAAVPEGANLGLGCGNPLAFAELKAGDVVVDLGSGAGFDCFIAAPRVGPMGRVIGVDMTPDMIERAWGNAKKAGRANVEFRLGEIEHLPVADNSADMIISNCVINLSTDKPQVFREALRVLKPGGRLMVSDLVLLRALPESVRESVEAYAGCVSGAMLKDDYLRAMKEAGFKEVEVAAETRYPIGSINPDTSELAALAEGLPPEDVAAAAESVVSVKVRAVKA